MTDDNLAISDLTLERYRLDELPVADRARVEARLDHDAEARTRLAALEQSDIDIQHEDLVARLTRSTAAAAAGSPAARRWVPAWSWPVAAAMVVLVIATALWVPRMPVAGDDRIKGEAASLLLYRKTDAGSELLGEGALARPGDLIRVAYRTGAPCFGVIVSIDGAGVVTRHLPVDLAGASPLRAGDATPLDQAYELDAAPKFERFFLITADRAFDAQMVMDAARRVVTQPGEDVPATLPLPPGFTQSTFLLRKSR